MSPVVVKVGGSLYDLADLGPRLMTFLDGFAAPVLVVPGGGATADAIRKFDGVHRLGDEASHWLALRACAVNGHFLAKLLGDVPVVFDPSPPKYPGRGELISCRLPKIAVVDLFAFAADDEHRPDHWPHQWDVTSDSLALRVATVARASELTLLKSIDMPVDSDWSTAASNGVVDPFFPTAIRRTPGVLVRGLNFRTSRQSVI